jgi:hypothetical protein
VKLDALVDDELMIANMSPETIPSAARCSAEGAVSYTFFIG